MLRVIDKKPIFAGVERSVRGPSGPRMEVKKYWQLKINNMEQNICRHGTFRARPFRAASWKLK